MNRRAALTLAGMVGLSAFTRVAATETTDDHKTILQRYIDEVVNGGNLAVIPELIAPDFATDDPEDAPGIDGLTARLVESKAATAALYDTITYALADIVAEHDLVMARGSVAAVRGDRTMTADWFIACAFVDGKIHRSWSLVDVTAL